MQQHQYLASTHPLRCAWLALIVIATLGGCQLNPPRPVPVAVDPSIIPGHPPRESRYPIDKDTKVVGQLRVVIAHKEDTLFDIARRYNLGYKELTAANPGVDPWLPREGTRILLPTRYILLDAPRQGIVINLPAMRLFYYPKPKKGEAREVITHPVGIGRENWMSPLGQAKIIEKVANPVWVVPASIRKEHAEAGDPLPAVVPSGPDNPLGMYALRLNRGSYLIHGTNKPAGIGMRVSHGCIQMFPEDIETLYEQVKTGIPVQIVNQPLLAAWDQDNLYLEAHAPLEEQAKTFSKSRKPAAQVLKKAQKNAPAEIDQERVAEITKNYRGIPEPVTLGSPSTSQLIAAAPVYRPPTTMAATNGKDNSARDASPAGQQPSENPAEYVPLSGLSPNDTIPNQAMEPLPATAPQAMPIPAATPAKRARFLTVATTSTSMPQRARPIATANGRWFVQAGSFSSAGNAQQLINKLQTLGPAIRAVSKQQSGRHRVLAGPFNSRPEAEANARRIEAQLGMSAIVLPPERG